MTARKEETQGKSPNYILHTCRDCGWTHEGYVGSPSALSIVRYRRFDLDAIWLSVRRAFGAAAPADNKCVFIRRQGVRIEHGTTFRDYIEVMRCDDEWHHTGAHHGSIVEERS